MPIGGREEMARAFRRARITTTVVEKLQIGESISDTDLPGYCVRRQQNARVYFVRKHANGRRHFVTIGEHGKEGWTEHKARQTALIIIGSLKQGRDPAAERAKMRGMPTLAEFADDFISGHGAALKKGTLSNYRSTLNKHVAPRDESGRLRSGCPGKLRLDQVTNQNVASLHRALKATPRAANHVLDFLSSLYSQAQAAGLVPEGYNPARRIRRIAVQPRQRFLSEQELARVGAALAAAEADRSENPFALAAIRLLIFTGCRRNEILEARWDWIDFEKAVLNLPDSKTGAKAVRLSPPALEVLQDLPRVAGNPFVIVGARDGQRRVSIREAWVRVRERAELAPVALPNGVLQHVRLHDLRHSFASLLASGGASLAMIGALLGHSNPQTTARYAHLADDPLRRVADEAGRRAAAAMRPSCEQPAAIIHLRQKP
jgi:integrase